jgi:hypothetical protein
LPAGHQKHVVGALLPGRGKSGPDDGAPMPLPTIIRMRNNVLQQCVRPPAAHQVWHGRQHAGCYERLADRAYEQMTARTRQYLIKDLPCSVVRKRRPVRVQMEIEFLKRAEVGRSASSHDAHNAGIRVARWPAKVEPSYGTQYPLLETERPPAWVFFFSQLGAPAETLGSLSRLENDLNRLSLRLSIAA